MQNQENKIAANKRLAELLGWSKIAEVNGALIGTPPAGAAESRGQALVPDWAGDWREAGPLLVGFGSGVCLEFSTNCVSVMASVAPQSCRNRFLHFAGGDDDGRRNDMVRIAAVLSVIEQLEAGQ